MAIGEQNSETGADVLGYILVGGASSRFGRDKALVELDGRPMYARIAHVLKAAGIRDISLVGDPGKYGNLEIGCISDIWPGEGPLGGIVSALDYNEAVSLTHYNLIVSCDMPFLTPDWVAHLVTRASTSEAPVVLPQSKYGLEPLCSVLHTDIASGLKKQFRNGVRKVTEALKQFRMEVLDERDWKRFDSAGRLFWNMNTAADYEEARRIVEAGQG